MASKTKRMAVPFDLDPSVRAISAPGDLAGHEAEHVAWAPNGARVATVHVEWQGNERTAHVAVHEWPSGKEIARMHLPKFGSVSHEERRSGLRAERDDGRPARELDRRARGRDRRVARLVRELVNAKLSLLGSPQTTRDSSRSTTVRGAALMMHREPSAIAQACAFRDGLVVRDGVRVGYWKREGNELVVTSLVEDRQRATTQKGRHKLLATSGQRFALGWQTCTVFEVGDR